MGVPIMQSKAEDRQRLIRQLMSWKKGHYGPLRSWFDRFEQRLKENEDRGNVNGYFVGNMLSIADLKVFGHFRNYDNGLFEELYGVPRTVWTDNGYHRISEFLRKMRQIPKIQTFITEYDRRMELFESNNMNDEYRVRIYPGKLLFAKL